MTSTRKKPGTVAQMKADHKRKMLKRVRKAKAENTIIKIAAARMMKYIDMLNETMLGELFQFRDPLRRDMPIGTLFMLLKARGDKSSISGFVYIDLIAMNLAQEKRVQYVFSSEGDVDRTISFKELPSE